MVGRFIGSYVLRKVKPGYVLALQCGRASSCCSIVAMSSAGNVAMWSRARDRPVQLDHVPDDLHARRSRSSARHTGEGSGVLCMAIVGGAIVPVIQGYFADHLGILTSFFVPAVCYGYIVYYGFKGSQVRAGE